MPDNTNVKFDLDDDGNVIEEEDGLTNDGVGTEEEGNDDKGKAKPKTVEELEEELNNLKTALKQEREKAKKKSQDNSYKVALLERKVQEVEQTKKEEEILAEHEDDDVITVADLKRLLQSQEQKQKMQLVADRIESSMDLARLKWENFDEVTAELQTKMMNDRSLAAEIIGPNGEYARRVGVRLYNKAKELGMVGETESKEEKMRKDATKKVMKEIKKPSTTSNKTMTTVKPGSKKLAEMDLDQKRKLMRKGRVDVDTLNESWVDLMNKGG